MHRCKRLLGYTARMAPIMSHRPSVQNRYTSKAILILNIQPEFAALMSPIHTPRMSFQPSMVMLSTAYAAFVTNLVVICSAVDSQINTRHYNLNLLYFLISSGFYEMCKSPKFTNISVVCTDSWVLFSYSTSTSIFAFALFSTIGTNMATNI